MHPTGPVAQPVGSQQMLAHRLTIGSIRRCPLRPCWLSAMNTSHHGPQAPHSPIRPAHFQFGQALNHSSTFAWPTLVLHPEHISILHPHRASQLKGHLQGAFPDLLGTGPVYFSTPALLAGSSGRHGPLHISLCLFASRPFSLPNPMKDNKRFIPSCIPMPSPGPTGTGTESS